MEMQIKTELQGDLLFVTYTGTATLDSSVRLLNRVTDIAAEKRIHKILLNQLAISGILSTLERYEIAMKGRAHLAQLGISPNVALVGVPPSVDGFAVLVAQNRGVTVDVFPTVEKALAWLDTTKIHPPTIESGP